MSKHLDIEMAILERISEKLENGTDFDDPRNGGGGYIYGGEVFSRGGKAVFDTPPINDGGEYFEITCTRMVGS